MAELTKTPTPKDAGPGRPRDRRREDEEEPDSEPKSESLKTKMLFGAGLAVFGLVVMGATLLLLRSSSDSVAPVPVISKKPEIQYVDDPDNVLGGALLKFNPFVVNLLSPDSYVTLAFAVEFFDFEVPKDVDQRMPSMRDAVITLLSNKNPRELLSETGREKFRFELINTLNKLLSDQNQVVDLYYTKFFIQ